MKKIHLLFLAMILVVPICISQVYAQSLYVDVSVGDMDPIEESKYRATGISVLRNSDGGLISVVRVDATRYLNDPVVDRFLKSNPDYLVKQGTINGERVSLHKVEVDYNNPECLTNLYQIPGYSDPCEYYHRAFVTMLGINDEEGESHTIFRGLNHVYTVKSLDDVTTIWHIITQG
ncbi:MAG: hypothetical protein HN808_04775 [Thaumarchaeota archaeon]|jgi:hypothetical protein|nr:hypothetical protein [Nitrososphaerota archaeon]MBT4056712.1 hypothetical protein [Nitrososphaerota archaeon]MBT7359892.1 hypothetical protein [Nitrososphaerota archaeon]|tara:strand:+ start:440 stop:967 length:528 start_codon:yes stop_codon:yes gene_type:complete